MRVPLSWLKDFVPLETSPRDADAVRDLAHVLDSLGLVVESIEMVGDEFNGVVLARVLEIHPIKGADRIRRIVVDAGEGMDRLDIVCGAWNFDVDDVVPLATVGTTLPNGMAIEARALRGVRSNGMLCSPAELGLAQDQSGLYVLGKVGADGLVPGRPLAEYLGRHPDVVFDVAVEPNRPDALSILGVARDLAAKLSLPLVLDAPVVLESDADVATRAFVRTDAPQLCPQLVGRVLSGLSEFPSLGLVRERLELVGMRSISAVVDASNYAMLELGQPSHPYDLARLSGPGIAVRLARPGETLATLDGTIHELTPEDLLIVDGQDVPVGLAGVMGGASSEISAATTDVLLEVANFEPIVIGKAGARHGLRTEAMARFWRGVDPEGLDRCADRVVELVQAAALAAGAPVPLAARGRLADRPVQRAPVVLELSKDHVNALLGTALGTEEITGYLAPLGFSAEVSGDTLTVRVPSFRPDATRVVDLIEEIARHHGYERIPARTRRSPYVGQLNERQRERRRLEELCCAFGADEAWTSTIVDPRAERLAGNHEALLELSNPIVAGESALRSHLLPGLLQALRLNEGQRNGFVRLFEIGRVFEPLAGEEPVREREHLGVIFAREDDGAAAIMALFDALVDLLRLDRSLLALVQDAHALASRPRLSLGLRVGRAALVSATGEGGTRFVGALGEIDERTLLDSGVAPRPIGAAFFDLGALTECARRTILAEPVSKFPPLEIDLAFVLSDERDAASLEALLVASAPELLEAVSLVDVYRGPSVPDGSRSLAYRLRFRAKDRTLSDEEIAPVRARIIERARVSLGATLRA